MEKVTDAPYNLAKSGLKAVKTRHLVMLLILLNEGASNSIKLEIRVICLAMI